MFQKNKKEIAFNEVMTSLKEFYRPFWGVMMVIFFLLLIQQAIALISPYLYGKLLMELLKENRYEKLLIYACFPY